MPHIEDIQKLIEFVGSLSLITGAMAWYRAQSQQEDEVVAKSCDVIIDTVSNADDVANINSTTGINLRNQITLEEIEDMHRERQLRRMRNRN